VRKLSKEIRAKMLFLEGAFDGALMCPFYRIPCKHVEENYNE